MTYLVFLVVKVKNTLKLSTSIKIIVSKLESDSYKVKFVNIEVTFNFNLFVLFDKKVLGNPILGLVIDINSLSSWQVIVLEQLKHVPVKLLAKNVFKAFNKTKLVRKNAWTYFSWMFNSQYLLLKGSQHSL